MRSRKGFLAERHVLYGVLAFGFVVGAALILGGIAFEDDLVSPWPEFLTDLGIAFVVAAIVGAVIERYLRESLYQQIETHIANSLQAHRRESIDAIHFQRSLPPEISELVRRTIIEQPFVERDVRFDYRMDVVRIAKSRWLRAELVSTAVLENLADEPRTTKWEEETPHAEWPEELQQALGQPGFVEVALEGLTEGFHGNVWIRGDNIKFHVSQRRGHDVFSREITVPAHGRVRVYSTELRLFEEDDWEWVSCMRPTINFEVTVQVRGAKFEFSADFEHPLESQWISEVDNEAGVHKWGIRGGLAPGQGLSFGWERRRARRPRRVSAKAAPPSAGRGA